MALIGPAASRGGLRPQQVLVQLLGAGGSVAKWGFDPETTPGSQLLYDHLFHAVAIEWNRA